MSKSGLDDINFDFAEPTRKSKSKALHLWSTFYHVYSAQSNDDGIPLLDMQGKTLKMGDKELDARLSEPDFCKAAIEGTVRIVDAHGDEVTYNYVGLGEDSQCDCSPYAGNLPDTVKKRLGATRWGTSAVPFGTGAEGMALIPFRSIAVDSKYIPYRSVVYVPAARGIEVTLPPGRIREHDGYFYAADSGGAVKDNHIDVFCGLSDKPFADFITSNPECPFNAFLIEDHEIAAKLATLHDIP